MVTSQALSGTTEMVVSSSTLKAYWASEYGGVREHAPLCFFINDLLHHRAAISAHKAAVDVVPDHALLLSTEESNARGVASSTSLEHHTK